MQIRIAKNHDKPHVIRYIRDNGTETWMYSDDFFVRHDLSHYAIETVLEYKTAFNGMLNGGMDIKDFEDREKRLQMIITPEAAYAENMANLFLMETTQGEFEDFNSVQQQAITPFREQFPEITLPEEKINSIRRSLRELLQRWEDMPVGETLELSFAV